jgi:hypothetical protein
MPTYLAENEIGFDTSLVGFPGLGSCMGVVLQTAHGLFGFHAYGSNSNKTPSFGTWSSQHGSYGPPTHLYGSCRWDKRYAGRNLFVSWLEEMRGIATALNYHGPVSGFDLSSEAAGIGDLGSAYLEYERPLTGSNVVIRYAHMDKVDQGISTTTPTTVQVIRPDLNLAPPYKNKVTVSVTPKAGSGLDDTANLNDRGFYSVTL